eukprot:gene15764-11286_t
MGFFDDEKNSVGSLTTALADDCRLVNRAFSESFARQMQALCNLAVSLALSFSASWKITLVVLATFPLVIGSSAVQMQAVTASQYEDVSEDKQNATAAAASSPSKTPSTSSKSKSQQDGERQVLPQEDTAEDAKKKDLMSMTGGPGAIISTAFTQIRTVSAFSMHQALSEQYNELTQLRSQVRVDRSIWGGIGFGGANAIQFWIYALLFWYGAILMRRENLSFVNLMISIFALMMGALGLGQALSDMGDQKAAFLAADRIFRCIDEGKQSSIDGLSTDGDYNYVEFISNSKSGQFFFYSHDGKYMLKTQTKEENKFLLSILPQYYEYLRENPNSLLVRILGMHRINMYHLRRKVHFVIMASVFDTPAKIHTIYDLKGSLTGREATPEERENGGVLKDMDLLKDKRKFHFGRKKAEFVAQLRKDAEFLAKLNIMDYSLLVGTHYRSQRPPIEPAMVNPTVSGSEKISVATTGPVHVPPTAAGGTLLPAQPHSNLPFRRGSIPPEEQHGHETAAGHTAESDGIVSPNIQAQRRASSRRMS